MRYGLMAVCLLTGSCMASYDKSSTKEADFSDSRAPQLGQELKVSITTGIADPTLAAIASTDGTAIYEDISCSNDRLHIRCKTQAVSINFDVAMVNKPNGGALSIIQPSGEQQDFQMTCSPTFRGWNCRAKLMVEEVSVSDCLSAPPAGNLGKKCKLSDGSDGTCTWPQGFVLPECSPTEPTSQFADCQAQPFARNLGKACKLANDKVGTCTWAQGFALPECSPKK